MIMLQGFISFVIRSSNNVNQLVAVHAAVIFFLTLFCEFHHAVFQGKQGKVAAHSHVIARKKLGAFLADQNAARAHALPGKKFDPQALGA